MLFLAGQNFEACSWNFLRDPKSFQGYPATFLPKLLPGETLCKFLPIFPPKDLIYRGEKILSHLFINIK